MEEIDLHLYILSILEDIETTWGSGWFLENFHKEGTGNGGILVYRVVGLSSGLQNPGQASDFDELVRMEWRNFKKQGIHHHEPSQKHKG